MATRQAQATLESFDETAYLEKMANLGKAYSMSGEKLLDWAMGKVSAHRAQLEERAEKERKCLEEREE